jgi:hypothetical protein
MALIVSLMFILPVYAQSSSPFYLRVVSGDVSTEFNVVEKEKQRYLERKDSKGLIKKTSISEADLKYLAELVRDVYPDIRKRYCLNSYIFVELNLKNLKKRLIGCVDSSSKEPNKLIHLANLLDLKSSMGEN